jgi:diadenosine tetraphosphate (Ap4A) HIT family hydrolase
MDNCVFCKLKEAIDKDRIIYEDSDWLAVLDNYPVSEGHTLLIPKRHCETFFDLSDVENQYFIATLNVVKGILDGRYNPDGYNIGMNCGEAAGQTVMHCHIHIIPRYKGDCENPRGGVRGVIPSRMDY